MTKPMDFHNRITNELIKGKTKKQICDELNCCYRTLEKYTHHDPQAEPIATRTRNTKGKAVYERIKFMFEQQKCEQGYVSYTAAYVARALADSTSPFNTACDDFEDLSSVTISESTLRRYCREIKKELNAKQRDIVSKLDHDAGHAQADFGQIPVYLQGVGEISLNFFVLTFPFSNMRYFVPVWGQNIECVIEGFEKIVKHLGCVPSVVRFDNMSSAVSRVLTRSSAVGRSDVYDPDGHPRVLTEMFKCFMHHFGFSAEFCNTASGWEKGHVENTVKFIKSNFFAQTYSFDGDWDSFQNTCLEWCDKIAKQKHFEKVIPICELFEQERVACRPVPAPFVSWKKERILTMATEGSAMVDGYRYPLYCSDKEIYVVKKSRTLDFYRTTGEAIMTAMRQYSWQQPDNGIEHTNWPAALEHTRQKIASFKSSAFAKCLHEDVRDYLYRLNADHKRKLLSIALEIYKETGSIRDCIQRLEEAYRRYRDRDVSTIFNAFRDNQERDVEKPFLELNIPGWDPHIERDKGFGDFFGEIMDKQNRDSVPVSV